MTETHTPFDLSELQILLVEDNKYMQLLLRNVLRAFKIRRVQSADNGVDALNIMKTFHPDIIFCDWSMEVIDGFDFTRFVRTGVDSPNPYVPIIMLSGYSEARRICEARDVGVTEYLVKPISAEMIYERICSVIERPRKFIKTKSFFGPDRRRIKPTASTNRGRRAEDKAAVGADDDQGKAVNGDSEEGPRRE